MHCKASTAVLLSRDREREKDSEREGENSLSKAKCALFNSNRVFIMS